MVEVITTDEFKDWYHELSDVHADSVIKAVRNIETEGVNLGFPYSSQLLGTKKYALREPCEGAGSTDPDRVRVRSDT